MGYQVTIIRENSNITQEEWRNYVASDAELELLNEDWSPTIWLKLKNEPIFQWEDIGGWAWSPDEPTIYKMLEIANKLNAKVIGEDETLFQLSEKGQIIEIQDSDEI